MKWDGHTHSQFCKHGSGEDTALMIERAILLGFDRYSVVEHAPLPDGIIEDPEIRRDFGLNWEELEDYFNHLEELKRVYGSRIEILSGLEIDFFAGMESFATDLVDACSGKLDDVILSLHFIKGKDRFQALDYQPDVFEKALLNYYGTIDEVHRAYWRAVEHMIDTGLRLPSTKRIGHLGLINKFAGLFEKPADEIGSLIFFEPLFRKIKSKGWALDFNVAGLNQKWYQDLYLTAPMLVWIAKLNIDLVYGSDAHRVEAVGQYYDRFLKFTTN